MKTKQQKPIVGIIAAVVVVLIAGYFFWHRQNTQTETATIDTSKTYLADIIVKDYGTIQVALDPKEAPLTCQNFIELANDGFYDNLTFHRIMKGFMIQGGDPNGDGTGGSEKTIQGEFQSNGVDNKLAHERGTISMARSSDPNSASSQFFICDADDPFLDGDYAAFGHVVKGMDVVDKIASDAKPLDNNGTIAKDEQPVIETIQITEE
ncbi:peptidylprolyl isomerase [uncultured Dubosiella sp.]|uniref:peptidylprolyl isomerase n=1 Tax=uncultured Dubosiella sp. TaxID=1937011 RepID=UPI0025B2B0E7|nr:peptidylprolyl isomerase [uncultured Dubosiella sp.]